MKKSSNIIVQSSNNGISRIKLNEPSTYNALSLNTLKSLIKCFKSLNDDEKTVAAMDVLAPGIGEIIGGSQREERLAVLDQRIGDPAMQESLWWYRDLRRYGTVPHAGFGLGFERLLTYVTGMDNIRDAIPFPRVPGNAQF